jgi:MarR family transcriptional regulator, organic hydroperoxide resistance regulator
MAERLENHVPYLVTRVASLVREAVAPILAEFDITLPMWRILAALAQDGEQTVGELLIATSLEQSTLSRTITALQRAGLISKKNHRDDARSITIAILAKGRTLNERLAPYWDGQHRMLVAGVDAADLERFKAVLAQLYANIAAATNSPTAKMRSRAAVTAPKPATSG